MNLIFDLGANDGGNIEYYLEKADKVVAVEANPKLASIINSKFPALISSGKLSVVNACLSLDTATGDEVDFYVHKYESGSSRLLPPKENSYDYDKISIPCITYNELIDRYGKPDYVKTDLEGYDRFLISYLVTNNLLPSYISFENSGKELLKTVLSAGKYTAFNIVSFFNYEDFYEKKSVRTAGPMGDDLISPWLDGEQIMKLHANIKHSWFDVHATTSQVELSSRIDYSYYHLKKDYLIAVKKLVPNKIKSKIKDLIGYKR